MRRGAILVVPMRVLQELGIGLRDSPDRFLYPEGAYRGIVLSRLGVSRAAVPFCDRWWENLKTDCVNFRFQSDERGSIMPEWPEWSVPYNVWYDRNSFGDPGWRATMLNAYFPAEPSEPNEAVSPPRRLVSLEG